MRPAPREPSKQLNAKSLPATNRRAASGLRTSARAETAASKLTTTIATHAIITCSPLPLPPPQRPQPPVNHTNQARLCRMLVNKSSTWLPDLNHDAAANAALDDIS